MSTLPVCRPLLVCAVSTLCTGAFAASPNSNPDDVIVTATRTEQQLEAVVGAVAVIPRAEIERRQVQSVQDLLRGELGIDITNQGGLGKYTSVFMRGTNPSHILVLIDGVRTGSATTGTTSFEFIPIDQVERVEIVRGPRSSIYGSDAISGAIQIFTRRAGPGFATSIGVGSDDTYRATARLSAMGENAWFTLTGDRLQSEGYNSCRGSFSDACFTIEPDRDGFRNTSGSVRYGYRFGTRAEIELSALYAQGLAEFDGGFSNEADFRQIVPTLRGRVRVTDDWTLSVTLGDSRDELDSLDDGTFRSRFDTEKRSGTLQSDWRFSETQLITLGIDSIDDRVDSTTQFAEATRYNTGVFGVYQARFGTHEAELSARYDDNEQFGTHATGNIGWKWHLAPSLAVLATYGSAFRAPSFNDLYYPGFSNPELDPEQARSYEVGLSGSPRWGRWSVNGFVTKIEDLIDLNSSFVPENVSKARIRGIEAFSGMSVKDWRVDVNYTWLDPRNRSEGRFEDSILQRRARHSARLGVTRAFGRLSLGTEVRAQGARYNNSANSIRLGSYAVADLRGEYRIGSNWLLQLKVANVFDRSYETVYRYVEPDRSYALTVRHAPSGL